MIEKDPNGIAQHDPGAKLDEGKIRAGLLEDFGLALVSVAEVLSFGAKKYSPGGWQHVPDGESRYRDAAWRHLLIRRHEERDQESGLLHDAQVIWNFLAALELKLRAERESGPSGSLRTSDSPDGRSRSTANFTTINRALEGRVYEKMQIMRL